MQLTVFSDAQDVAKASAKLVADKACQAVSERGKFVMALSGGSTPWKMIQALANESLPWHAVHILQVDERVAPPGHADRNLTQLLASLAEHAPISPDNIHAMPVNEDDLTGACHRYEQRITQVTGPQNVIDLVHLGLGEDGHTASLIPGDAVLEVSRQGVAHTSPYQGRHRMTLTYPLINAARDILWLVTGATKVEMLRRLIAQDQNIPAGRVSARQATIFADSPAHPET